MEKQRRSASREAPGDSTNRPLIDSWITAAALAVGAALLSWPFLIAPGRFLYIRYFDADTIFGPVWKLHDLVSVWDAHLHLGYAHARDLSYLSVQELVSVMMTPLGEDFRNRSSLICVALAIFFAFWWFARLRFPGVPGGMSAVAAFFYAANPFVVAFVHDGYSGLLVDYALLPAALLIVEWARRKNLPMLLSLIPFAFVITGMYNLTSVLVALIGVLVFEFRYIYSALRASKIAATGAGLAVSLNVYWLVPLVYDLMLHPKQSILAESANDISALTSAGTLTNTFLLRSYPEIWTKAYGTRECVGCMFYESPWFVIAMLFVAIAAIVGLIRARKYGLLAALVASILVATGYHYQNEIIGIPYLILMGLPTFDMFRSSVKFSALTAALYGVGLLYCYANLPGRRRVFATVSTICALLVAAPYVTGSMIERSPDSPPHFPNFVVSIPPYYEALRKHKALLPDDRPTLLLPNMPLAAYGWGAYGNDFVGPYLAKPTLAVSYLPQPSWQLELILQRLTAGRTPKLERESLLTVLGIERSLYRDDVTQTRPLPKADFGTEIASFGNVHVLSNEKTFPRFGVARSLDPVSGVVGVATYAGLWQRPTRAFAEDDSAAVCAGKMQIGIEPSVKRRGRQSVDVPFVCKVPLSVIVAFADPQNAPALLLRRMSLAPGRQSLVFEKLRGGSVVIALLGRALSIAPQQVIKIIPLRSGSASFEFQSLPFAHYTIFSESFDPAWQGYVQISGKWLPIRNFAANGFANAWYVPAKAPLRIVNTLQRLVSVAAGFALVLFAGYLFVFWRGLQFLAR
jgi:hypothetical protein